MSSYIVIASPLNLRSQPIVSPKSRVATLPQASASKELSYVK